MYLRLVRTPNDILGLTCRGRHATRRTEHRYTLSTTRGLCLTTRVFDNKGALTVT